MRNVVLIGGDQFAVKLATFLTRRDNKLTMVIAEKERALEVSSEHSEIIVVNGNPTDPNILDEVKLESCDIFIAADEQENINLLAAMYAKKAGVARIFVRTSNVYTSKIIEDIGFHAINYDFFAASSAALKIMEPYVSDLITMGASDFEIVEKRAEYFPNLLGHQINDVKGEFFATLALYQDGAYHFDPNTKIKEDSILICIREAGKREEMRKAMKELFSKEKK